MRENFNSENVSQKKKSTGLMELRITTHFKSNSYKSTIVKDAGNMAMSLNRPKKYLTSPVMPYLYSNHIRPKVEYC